MIGVTQLSAGEVTAAMASNSFNIARHGRVKIETCASIAREAVGVRIVHGVSTQAVAAIRKLLSP